MELSAVLITYNAERYLQPVLEALRGLADEIIIVDSGSTDRTEAIAAGFPEVRWYKRPFDGYGSQKNYANALASGRYILSIDADEVLSPELRQAILQEKGHWRAEAYRMLRVAVYCGAFIRAGDWYPDWKVRLFRRGVGRWSEDPVHEKLLLPAGTQILTLRGEMWHYTYDTPEENLLRTSKYARLHAEALHKAGTRISWSRAFLKAIARFFKSLFLKGGWRLGWRGVSIAFMGAIFYVLRAIYLAHLSARDKAPFVVSSSHDTDSSADRSVGVGSEHPGPHNETQP